MQSKNGCKQLPHHVGEKCGFQNARCGKDAFHKVGSEDPTEFHNLTQYLCCQHYAVVMGAAAPCAAEDR